MTDGIITNNSQLGTMITIIPYLTTDLGNIKHHSHHKGTFLKVLNLSQVNLFYNIYSYIEHSP